MDSITEKQHIQEVIGKWEGYKIRCIAGDNRSKPNILLYDRDENMIAVMCLKCRAIHDKPKSRSKRIDDKMCMVELKFAMEYEVPMVLHVTNTANGRQWVCIVEFKDLKDWNGITTPDILAKGDEKSAETLEAGYRDAVICLGGLA